MSRKPPRRYKTTDELTVDEHAARRRGAPMPETDEYKQARNDALAAAGIKAEDDAGDPYFDDSQDDPSIDAHIARQHTARGHQKEGHR